jgi:hypothetical protein
LTPATALAVATKRSVMIATAGMPSLSASIASCKLHDEQLPQSPVAASIASAPLISISIGCGTGRDASGLRRRMHSRTR